MNLLFDSNIIMDALAGIEFGRTEIRTARRRYLSVISWIEVLVGCRTPLAENAARELLDGFSLLLISPEIAERAVLIRRNTRLKLPDATILATAQVSGLQLSTRNTKDFPENDPTIRVPYQL